MMISAVSRCDGREKRDVPMTVAGWLEIALTLALVVVVAWPLGAFHGRGFRWTKDAL